MVKAIIIIIIVSICVILLAIYAARYGEGGFREKYVSPELLKENAKIISVDHKIVGSKYSKGIETSILFDDGYRFITRDADRKDHIVLGYHTVSMSEETLNGILIRAYKAHAEAVEEARNKINKQG